MAICNRFFLRSLLVLFSIFFAGCSRSELKEEEPRQVLRVCLAADILSFHPHKGVDMPTQGVLRSLFSGLVCTDEASIPQLDLASSYTCSDDCKRYTFFLRDCKWSDGSCITAYDFEESWKLALTPGAASVSTYLLYFIKNGKKIISGELPITEFGVCALDDKTLLVELEEPAPDFLSVVANSIFLPVHKTMRSGDPLPPSATIVSGPFRLKEHIFRDRIVVEKNRLYWRAANTRLEGIEFLVIQNPDTALLMFEKGGLDFLGGPLNPLLPTETIPSSLKKYLHWVEGAGTRWLFLNTQKLPLTNVNIRKALALSIDRASLVQHVWNLDPSFASLELVPKIVKKERWHPWMKDNDGEQAREYFTRGLQELGMTPEQFPKITISGLDCHKNELQVIGQMWMETLGISTISDCIEMAYLLQKSGNLEHDVTRLGWTMQYGDPTNALEVFKFKAGQSSFTGWENADFVREANAAAQSTGSEKWSHVEAAERIFFAEMPAIPIFNSAAAVLQKPYVVNVHINCLMSIEFRDAYIKSPALKEDRTNGPE